MSKSKSEFMAIQEMYENDHQYKLLQEYVLINKKLDKQIKKKHNGTKKK